MISRRKYVSTAISGTVLLIGPWRAKSAQTIHLRQTDPIARALGYKKYASAVDPKNFAMYRIGQCCANCQIFQGKKTDASGACATVGGRLVNAVGWCAAWVTKS